MIFSVQAGPSQGSCGLRVPRVHTRHENHLGLVELVIVRLSILSPRTIHLFRHVQQRHTCWILNRHIARDLVIFWRLMHLLLPADMMGVICSKAQLYIGPLLPSQELF